MEITEKEKQKDSSFTDKYKMKENKENLKTKKNSGFSDHVYKKPPILTFLSTSNSSFKLTE